MLRLLSCNASRALPRFFSSKCRLYYSHGLTLCSSAFDNRSARSVNLLTGYGAFYGLFAAVSYRFTGSAPEPPAPLPSPPSRLSPTVLTTLSLTLVALSDGYLLHPLLRLTIARVTGGPSTGCGPLYGLGDTSTHCTPYYRPLLLLSFCAVVCARLSCATLSRLCCLPLFSS